MNILYIGTHNSIHDLKWMKYFANREDFKVFFVSERQHLPTQLLTSEIQAEYEKHGITYIGYLNSFSIRKIFSFIKSAIWLRQQLQKHHIDLVHILFATPHALWGLMVNTPYIITTRGSDILLVIPQLKKTTNLKGLYFRLLYRFFKSAFEKASLVTCTSLAQLKKVTELFQIKSTKIIRTGVDVHLISEIKKPQLLNRLLQNQKFVFSPRFFSPIYNIALQIQALEYLPQHIIRNYTFVFIRGKHYDENYSATLLLNLTQLKYTIGLKFIVEDYLDQESIWMYYKQASLTIMTPLSDGTPNSALEAMAGRCPVILPNLPYDSDIFQNATLVLKHNDPHQLAQLIEKALSEYPTEMLDLAYLRVNELGNRQIEMRNLEVLYKQLTFSHKASQTQDQNLS